LENNFRVLNRDSTDQYQKQITQVIYKCKTIINYNKIKSLTQIKPNAPVINALIKIYTQDAPVRPVINNITAPSYKLAKFLKKKL
jgi:hypothetical protein